MRKFLVWPKGVPELGIQAGDKDELTPITFEEFEKLGKWAGGSDIAFSQFLRHNKFHEVCEDAMHPYVEEALRSAIIVIEEGEPIIDWAITYGDIKRAQ